MKSRRHETTLDPVIQQELDALETALAGGVVDPEHADLAELATELRGLRPAPSEEFAATLDSSAADRFQGRPRLATSLTASAHRTASKLAERVRGPGRQRRLLPALAAVCAVLVVGTAIVVATDRNGANEGGAATPAGVETGAARGAPSASGAARAGGAPRQFAPGRIGGRAIAPPAGVIAPEPPLAGDVTAPGIHDRHVERSADLTLATDPDHVQEVAGRVFDVIGRYRGIVLRSSVRDGAEGEAGASFELLIPSARLSPALADLSALAEVRTRTEDTLDITAPFVSAREHLRDARAEAESLLRQLAAADTDAERASVKARLRIVRGRIAAFRSQVRALERRSRFSRVSVQVVTGKQVPIVPGGSGTWTIDDALRDASRVLTVAAGVVLIALAVALPLALFGAAAWTARRLYLHRAREQALGARLPR
jgi:hypothetical protein